MPSSSEDIQRAIAHYQAGRLGDAESLARAAIEANPQHADAWHVLGLVALSRGEHLEAIEHVRQAIASLDSAKNRPVAHRRNVRAKSQAGNANARSQLALYHNTLGTALAASGRRDEAAIAFRTAIDHRPDLPPAHNNLGNILVETNDPLGAAACFRRAIALDANYADAYGNLGHALRKQGKFEEAIATFRKLIKLCPSAASAHFSLGDTLIDLCDFDAAVECFRRSLQLDAAFVPAHSGLGGALFEQGEYEAAIRAFDRAIELKPDDPNARFSRSLVRLLLGDFERGWADHEWRKRTGQKYGERGFAQPIWKGESFAGQTFFLHHEQGFGDTIQALRYVPRIKALGGQVIVGCQPPLARLVQSVRGVDGIVSVGSELPAFDLHAPLMSVPAIFGTNLQSIPAEVPYVEADPSRVEEFRRIVGHADEVKVGIVWKGSSIHRRDRLRSFSPSQFAPIAAVPNVRLFSLQKGDGSEPLVGSACSFGVTDLAGEIDDFSDMAAAMRALDLVISCDSAPVHLAGALGVPVWIALPYVPDWRWLLNRDDSPWYPSARLFRQPQRGSWAGVFERMAAELSQFVRSRELPARAKPTPLPAVPATPQTVSSRAEEENRQGATLARERRWADAEGCFRRALELRPDVAFVHNNLGNVLRELGQLDPAIECYRQAVELDPNLADAHNNLGLIFSQREDWDAAATSFRCALRSKPDWAEAHSNLGASLMNQQKFELAAESFDRALALKPDLADAHNNLGAALMGQQNWASAAAAFERAIELRPEAAVGHSNLGTVLTEQRRVERAIEAYRRALELNPHFAAAHNNLALALEEQKQFDQAIALYDRAIELKPDYAEAHHNRGLLRLLRGDYAAGWEGYQWRWQARLCVARNFNAPAWRGESLAGKTILLHAEQGLGDTLQFIRFAWRVKEHGARVIFECPDELFSLLNGMRGVDSTVLQGGLLPEFDVHAPLMSLPRLLGTPIDTVGADVPYVAVDAARLERWREKLNWCQKLKVGVVWRGSPKHKRDRLRSFSREYFDVLASVPDVQLFSLQKPSDSSGPPNSNSHGPLVDLAPALTDFAETAAAIKNLDLVISCDSAPVHLAGALGAPAWVALPYVPDWRWLLDRDDSPWYPCVRLFRQQQRDCWPDVFRHMATALAELVAGRK